MDTITNDVAVINDAAVTSAVRFQVLAGMDTGNCPATSRVCRIVYREDKSGKSKKPNRPSLGAYVPQLSAIKVSELAQNAKVQEWLKGKLEVVQDTLARGAVEAIGAEGYNGCSIAGETTFSIDALLGAIDKELDTSRASGSRLSAESIRKWVADELAKPLADTLASKHGLAAESPKVIAVVKAFGDNIALLAGKSPLPEEVMVQILKALDLAPASPMLNKLLERVEILSALELDLDISL